MYIDKSLCLLYTLCRIILKRGVKFMDKSIRDLEFELYDYNSPQRLDYLRDDNFMISQHMLDKERDKILTVLHSHHYYEIEILLYGKVIEVVNGEETVSEPGGFVFVSPNDIHTCEFIEDKAVFLVIKMKLEIWLNIHRAFMKEDGIENPTDKEIYEKYPLPYELDYRMH